MREFGKRPGAMIYFSDWKAVRRLSMEQRGELITEIMEFAENGVAQVSDDPIVAVVFDLLSEKVARDAAAYRESCINRAYSTYCRECKKSGKEPADRNTWYQMIGVDTMQDHSESIGIIRGETETETEAEPETETEAEPETENDPEPETEREEGKGGGKGYGGTGRERASARPITDQEIAQKQSRLIAQCEELERRNGGSVGGM